jgi:hypothetical protein
VFVAVKGILALWKAALFAGCRRKKSLGRSVMLARVSPRASRRTDDSGCPKVAEEGNVVGMRHKAYATGPPQSLRVIRGRVLRSVLRPVHVNPHYTVAQASVVGRRTGITVGQTRASGRNHHWGRFGRT